MYIYSFECGERCVTSRKGFRVKFPTTVSPVDSWQRKLCSTKCDCLFCEFNYLIRCLGLIVLFSPKRAVFPAKSLKMRTLKWGFGCQESWWNSNHGPRWLSFWNICLSHAPREVLPERNLNVKLEEKVEPTPPHAPTRPPPSPLESSERDFGDPNPCCAQLFQPWASTPKKESGCVVVLVVSGGKLRSVIVAWLQSRQLTMLSSEIPQNLTTLEYHQTLSGCLWNATDTVWRCNLQALKSAPMLLK